MDQENLKYRKMLETYFNAFRTGDYSPVQFSSKIEFLTPLRDDTFKGLDVVVPFLSKGVWTRTTEVNVMSIIIDYPIASGVWQMRTTKGTLYTLHNFFRFDEEGIAYVWPMFDPKAIMADPDGLIQWITGEGY